MPKYPIDSQKDYTYLQKRLNILGVSPDQNQFQLSDAKSVSIFDSDEEGNIVLNYFNLHRNRYSWKKSGTKFPRYFFRTRLKHPFEDQKYSQEKGSGLFPFFTPRIIDKFQTGKVIETLFIVEGEFKAFKGYLEGLDIIGIPSIHGFYDGSSGSKQMHKDILEVIVQCTYVIGD